MTSLLLGALLSLTPSGTADVPYRWRNVQIVGAGFVDGVVFSPSKRDVRYARTDIGGAYRWDAAGRRWVSMLDWVPYADLNFMGVESLAVDPHDPLRIFLACGTYTNPSTPDGAVLRSADGGKSFQIARVPIKFGGNENGRGNGERLSVDPFDGRHLLMGTRHDGLWQSDDGAASWHRIDAFPAAGDPGGAGVVVTLFDPDHRGVAYAAASSRGDSLYRTEDGGATWSAVQGAPKGLLPTHLTRSADGALWLTYGSSPGPSRMVDGAVWMLKAGAWRDVTPDRPSADRPFGYAAVSSVGGAAIVSTFGHPGGEQIFRTTDDGAHWRPVIGGRDTFDNSAAPYVNHVGIHWLLDIEIDPYDPNHALFTTGYGLHETFDLRNADAGKPVHWRIGSVGIEESVGLSLDSPTKGVPLFSGIGDYGGFAHRNLDRTVEEGNYTQPHFGNTTGVASAAFAPEVTVRVGRSSGNGREANLGFSLDAGKHWRPPATTPPGAREGSIAVSPDGRVWVWSFRGGTFRTENDGVTWDGCKGLPPGLRAAADGSSPERFYALDLDQGVLYTSNDGARTFTSETLDVRAEGDRGDSRGGQDQVYASPGRSGDLWIAAHDGLYHRSPARSFVKLPPVETIDAFGFGAPPKGQRDATLFLVGVVQGRRGIFRSVDSGASWSRIDDDARRYGLILQISGDPKRFGRVYVGTHGRGIVYGDPR